MPTMNRLLEPTPSEYTGPSSNQKDISETSREKVIKALGPTPMLKDEIVRETGLTAAEVNIILMELALADRVHRDMGDRVSLIPEI